MPGLEVTIRRMRIISITILVCAAIFAVLSFYPPQVSKKTAGPAVQERSITGWREGFAAADGIKRWSPEIKPWTKPALFSIGVDPKAGISFLHMEADNASASLITRIDAVDINKTPILRWRWRVTTLPEKADGRIKARDDQAIGIYVGTGSMLNNKSVSYRWDTLTPVGAEGNSAYGLGAVKVKWYTLRNEKDASGGQWYTEERNIAEDFNDSWGYYPKDIYLSVSCNSQYTNSRASADLGWIEFVSTPEGA